MAISLESQYRKDEREEKKTSQNKIVAANIRRIQDEYGVDNNELATITNRDPADISRWRNKHGFNAIPLYELSLIADYFDNTCINWFISDDPERARNYEFDTVVKYTGLSEEAIKILCNKHESSKDFFPDGDGSFADFFKEFIDAINYLIVNGENFIEAFARAKRDIEQLKKAKLEHLDPFGIPEEATAIALTSYDMGWNKHGAKYTEALFSEEIEMYKFHMDDSSERRPLTKDEQHHLFEYANAAQLFHPKSARYYCMEQLTLLFSAIESSES